MTSRGRSPITSSTTTGVYQHTTLTEAHPSSSAPRPAPLDHVLDTSALPVPSLSRGHNHGMGYPHSLLGLHVLPTTLTTPDPQDLPHILGDGDLTGDALPTRSEAQALSPSEARVEEDMSSVHAIAAPASPEVEPSLGYLDEALRFIAEERDRWRAATHNKASVVANQDENDEVDGSGEFSSISFFRGKPASLFPHTMQKMILDQRQFPGPTTLLPIISDPIRQLIQALNMNFLCSRQ